MATAPTNFKFNYNSSVVDFYDVFEPGNASIVTGFKISGGTDLGNLFASGFSYINTLYKYNGNDLGTLFMPKLPFISSGSLIQTVTSNTTGPRYCYSIFTNNGITNKTITIKKNGINDGSLYVVCVGGGGSGGTSDIGISCGGGGGGGVYNLVKNLSEFSINDTLNVTVGIGGVAQQFQTIGGTESNIIYNSNYYIRCSGGAGGTTTGAGLAGGYYSGATLTLNGGNGGDRTNGNNSSYFLTSSIPSQITFEQPNYAYNSQYSGGGAGGKGDSDGSIYGGGGGGKGIGGTRPRTDIASYNGQMGTSWGGGGGGGGNESFGTGKKIGGNGADGIVIVYTEL